MNINSRYLIGHQFSPGRERRACCGYLNQHRGLSPLPQGKTTTPNYPLKHARSGSDRLAASTSPLSTRPRRSGPLRFYRRVIFMRFRGPEALRDRVMNRSQKWDVPIQGDPPDGVMISWIAISDVPNPIRL